MTIAKKTVTSEDVFELDKAMQEKMGKHHLFLDSLEYDLFEFEMKDEIACSEDINVRAVEVMKIFMPEESENEKRIGDRAVGIIIKHSDSTLHTLYYQWECEELLLIYYHLCGIFLS